MNQLSISPSESSNQAVVIKARAMEVKDKGALSKIAAEDLYEEKQKNIFQAIENGKIVDEIAKIASFINNVAAQTNLLALNASIEAASSFETIKDNMDETSNAMEQIAKAAENQAMVAETLNRLVAKFKF